MRIYLTSFFLFIVNANNLSASALDNFFSMPDVISAKLSPNGVHTVTINNTGINQHLNLITHKKLTKKTIFYAKDFTQKEATIRHIDWIDNHHIAVQFSKTRKGVKDLLDTRNIQYLLIIRLPNSSKEPAQVLSVKTKGWLVNPLPLEDNVFLYAKGGAYSKVYRINVQRLTAHKAKASKLTKIDGGQFIKSNEEASVEGYATRWFIDNQGKTVSSLHYIKGGALQLSAFNKAGDTEVLKTWPKQVLEGDDSSENSKNKILIPVKKANEENSFYCLDFSEEEERSVYKVNFSTNKEELVFEADSYKIISLITNNNNELMGVTVINNADIEHVYLDQHARKAHTDYNQGPTRKAVLETVVNKSTNNTRSLIFRESHSQPGQYFLKDNISGAITSIGSVYPHLVDKLKSRLVEDAVVVESLDIPYLLTLPEEATTPMPLIVVPHGGPIGVFDQRYFDRTTQYLAANGYAVLRVNFRGSSGYSEQLREAGKRQWGHLMLEDIYQATLAVTKRKDIDASKVCIFGMSYGGYAATMLTIKYPKLYQCAVNVAGVSDVNLYLNQPRLTKRRDAWAVEYIGDTVSNYDELKSISSVYHIPKLSRPLLIIHGAKDDVVDIEHAYRLKRMLDKYQKTYSWHIFPEMEHDLSGPAVGVLFEKVITFFQEQL